MKVVVGLGNPGRRYTGTRHNVGFEVLDRLAESPQSGRFQSSRFQAEIAELFDGELKVLLVKPTTFMNLSGQSVRQLMDFYQAPLEELLIVCDDINLPLGVLRARSRGTHGGHNGLRDIQNHLGSNEYSRLRIGVGDKGENDAADFVLDRFRASERPMIADAILRGMAAVAVWWREGIDACMNQYNG